MPYFLFLLPSTLPYCKRYLINESTNNGVRTRRRFTVWMFDCFLCLRFRNIQTYFGKCTFLSLWLIGLYEILQKHFVQLGLVVLTCNVSFWGGWGKRTAKARQPGYLSQDYFEIRTEKGWGTAHGDSAWAQPLWACQALGSVFRTVKCRQTRILGSFELRSF